MIRRYYTRRLNRLTTEYNSAARGQECETEIEKVVVLFRLPGS